MILKTVWEYYIYGERVTGEYKVWMIICNLNPVEGWAVVFKALSDKGEMRDVRKIQNASCAEKQIIIFEEQ